MQKSKLYHFSTVEKQSATLSAGCGVFHQKINKAWITKIFCASNRLDYLEVLRLFSCLGYLTPDLPNCHSDNLSEITVGYHWSLREYSLCAWLIQRTPPLSLVFWKNIPYILILLCRISWCILQGFRCR